MIFCEMSYKQTMKKGTDRLKGKRTNLIARNCEIFAALLLKTPKLTVSEQSNQTHISFQSLVLFLIK